MTKKKRKISWWIGIILTSLLIGMGIRTCHRIAKFMEAVAPNEYHADSDVNFNRNFPAIYHFLAGDEEYEAVNLRVLYGLGGRWGQLTLVRRDGASATRKGIIRNIKNKFESNGWKHETEKPGHSFFPSTFFEAFDTEQIKKPSDDLWFSHTALSSEREHVFHNCYVYVSSDADEIIAYCEMGW